MPWWEAVPRGALGEGLGGGEGSQGGGEGLGQISGLPSAPELRQAGLAVPPARLWHMPGIAGVFLALSLMSEGTRNISCPGRHGG